jgi:1-deoxy-D-xylulose-5-phosphate reductoisomerase
MTEFIDGTVIAQMAVPDMRLPIQYALTRPERLRAMTKRIDFSSLEELSLRKPDTTKFPCLELARVSLRKGGTCPAVLNAADEEAVRSYLEGRIKFSAIPGITEKVLSRHKPAAEKTLSIADILDAEKWAREEARSLCCH